MTRIAFIGLGNMGGGMAARLVSAGHEVAAFDLSAEALERAAARGCTPAASAREAVAEVEAVITMLPAGPQVRAVYAADILGVAPAGALLIESFGSARRRGVRIRGELAGYGESSDATHITGPSALGQAAAIRAALRSANVGPRDIGYINAHGTGTDANDATGTGPSSSAA